LEPVSQKARKLSSIRIIKIFMPVPLITMISNDQAMRLNQ